MCIYRAEVMHLVNDYLQGGLKHTQIFNNNTYSRWTWFQFKLIVIAPLKKCANVSHDKNKNWNVPREQYVCYFNLSLTRAKMKKDESAKLIKRSWSSEYRRKKARQSSVKARSVASVAHCITASLLHKYRYTIYK